MIKNNLNKNSLDQRSETQHTAACFAGRKPFLSQLVSLIKGAFALWKPKPAAEQTDELNLQSAKILHQLNTVKQAIDNHLPDDFKDQVQLCLEPIIREVEKVSLAAKQQRLKFRADVEEASTLDALKRKAKPWLNLKSGIISPEKIAEAIRASQCAHMHDLISKDQHFIMKYSETVISSVAKNTKQRLELQKKVQNGLEKHLNALQQLKSSPQYSEISDFELWRSQTDLKRCVLLNTALKLIEKVAKSATRGK